MKAYQYTVQQRLAFSIKASLSVLKNTWWAILIGVGIGAFVHGYIPQSFIAGISDNPFAPIIATILGVPIYSSTFAAIPIATVLYFKNMNIGTVLSFMMKVTLLSVLL